MQKGPISDPGPTGRTYVATLHGIVVLYYSSCPHLPAWGVRPGNGTSCFTTSTVPLYRYSPTKVTPVIHIHPYPPNTN